MKLDSSLTEVVSIENYEIRISRSDFMHIHEYLCRVSFLTTLDIYKDYFKGRLKWCKGCCNCCYTHIVIGDKIALVHHILSRSYWVFMLRVLWPMSFLIFIVDELNNFAVNNLLQVGGVSHVLGFVHWTKQLWLCVSVFDSLKSQIFIIWDIYAFLLCFHTQHTYSLLLLIHVQVQCDLAITRNTCVNICLLNCPNLFLKFKIG